MSVMTRKDAVRGQGRRAKQRALDTATQVVPLAKNASVVARQSAEDAAAWAAPRVKEARTWAAPHVEQAGIAVRDKIAPTINEKISEKIAPAISAALVEAARRLDDSRPKRRRWPRVLAGFAMLAAVASAAAAIMMRRRPETATFGAEDHAASAATPGQDDGSAAAAAGEDEDATVNGHMRSS